MRQLPQITYKGIEANIAGILAVKVDRTLEEGHSVREIALHLERAHSGCAHTATPRHTHVSNPSQPLF